MTNTIFIMHGGPTTGKSTVGKRLARLFQPLDIGGYVLTVDTTDFREDDFKELVQSINRLIGAPPVRHM